MVPVVCQVWKPSFYRNKTLEQTGSTTRDIVDLSSSINSLSLETAIAAWG